MCWRCSLSGVCCAFTPWWRCSTLVEWRTLEFWETRETRGVIAESRNHVTHLTTKFTVAVRAHSLMGFWELPGNDGTFYIQLQILQQSKNELGPSRFGFLSARVTVCSSERPGIEPSHHHKHGDLPIQEVPPLFSSQYYRRQIPRRSGQAPICALWAPIHRYYGSRIFLPDAGHCYQIREA